MTSEKNSNPMMMSLHPPFKKFSAYVDVNGKTRYCVSCSNIATQEVIFAVDGATIIKNTVIHAQKRI